MCGGAKSRRCNEVSGASDEGMASDGTEEAMELRSMRDDDGTRRERPERKVESALGARYARYSFRATLCMTMGDCPDKLVKRWVKRAIQITGDRTKRTIAS